MPSGDGQKLLQDMGGSPGPIGIGVKNPRLKGEKTFSMHVSSEAYEQLGKEFNGVFRIQ